jgi:hypothetical protein
MKRMISIRIFSLLKKSNNEISSIRSRRLLEIDANIRSIAKQEAGKAK